MTAAPSLGFPSSSPPGPPFLASNSLPPRTRPPRLSMALGGAVVPERPALFVQPASPAPSFAGSFDSAASSPPIQPAPLSGLAARRLKNKKQLSLVVPAVVGPPSLASPSSPSHLQPGGSSSAETRSLPPSPISLVAYIGVEGSEQEDRTIGRLMMKQQADEMREQMKGGRSMKRRTSIPRLNLGGAVHKPASLNLGSTNGGSAVQLIRRDAVENGGPRASTAGGRSGSLDIDDAVIEEFPYALGPREILPGIWLGSEQNARDPKVLKDWGFHHVLNVAKEVECPWTGEIISEDDEDEGTRLSSPDPESTAESSTDEQESFAAPPAPVPTKPTKPKHRRTKTHAVIPIASLQNTRAHFVRPTASTPNLQAAFASPPSPPPVPSIPASIEQRRNSDGEESPTSMLRSLSSSPPQRRSPPRSRPPVATTSSGPSSSLLFPSSRRTGRPALDYLWLKWGHDESDLVEAGKFQAAFDFLDQARASEGGKGKVLVHCQCGVSRSATVVIAYCMREAAKALEEGREESDLAGITGMHDAYSFVKEKSEWVGPNLCLVFQLVAYERTLRGAAPENDDEEPPFPDYANMAHSPRTPLSSEGSGSGSSDSQLSTPEAGDLSHSPSFSSTSQSTSPTPPLSIMTSRSDIKLRILPEDDEVLSPMATALSLNEHVGAEDEDEGVKAVESPSAGVFILPIPPRRFLDISPLPSNVTMSPPTPFCEIASPAPSRLTFGRHQPRIAQRWGFPSPPKATIVTSTPTASAFAIREVPTAAQLSLSRGLPPMRGPPSPLTEMEESSGRSKVFGGQQTPSQRRASHRRVFSWSSAMDSSTPPS